ncbi:MAG: response regulator [Gaiellaceae bacterium]
MTLRPLVLVADDDPDILLTARVQEPDVQRGFEAGADDYVTKPFSPQALGERVQAALGARPEGDHGG